MKSLKSFILEDAEDSRREFVILKPEFTDKDSDFEELLNNHGWKVIQKKKQTLSKEKAEKLYAMHKHKPFYDALINYMSSGPCVCYSVFTDDKTKKDPVKDMSKIKDEVRKVWGKDEMKNAMHSSDSLDNIKREMDIAFSQE